MRRSLVWKSFAGRIGSCDAQPENRSTPAYNPIYGHFLKLSSVSLCSWANFIIRFPKQTFYSVTRTCNVRDFGTVPARFGIEVMIPRDAIGRMRR